MAQAIGIGTGVILDTSQVPFSPLSSTNTVLISNVFRLARATAMSAQIITDGVSIVDYQVQVTNCPYNFGRAANQKILGTVTNRDDSAASNMWATVASGVIPKGGIPQGTIVTIANSIHEDARVILTYDAGNSGGTTAACYVNARNTGF